MVVTAIAANASNPNEWAFFDLQFDPEELFDAGDELLRDAIDGKVKRIRRASVNAPPGLLPIEFTPDNVRAGRFPREGYLRRACQVQDHSVFRERISRLLADRYADQPMSTHVEQRIYDAFPSRKDEETFIDFHRRDWHRRVCVIPAIEDERYRELAQRIIAVEQPGWLTEAQRRSWLAWREDRLFPAGETPWLNVAAALAELNELTDENHGYELRQVSEIKRFLKNLACKGRRGDLLGSDQLPDSRVICDGEPAEIAAAAGA